MLLRCLPLPVLLVVFLVSLAQRHPSDSVTAGLHDRGSLSDALQRLADAESARLRGSAALEPQEVAAHYFERFAGVFAIGVVDREYGLRWVQTRSPASLSLADLQSIEQVCDVLVRRPIESVLTVIDRKDLHAGGSGFLMAIPVLNRGRVASFVVALHRDGDFFSAKVRGNTSLTHP
jgi:hypothetical protein